MIEQTSPNDVGSIQSGPPGGYCVYEWDGESWNQSEDHCAPNYVFEVPPGLPGDYVGQTITYGCVPLPPIAPPRPEPPPA